MKTKLKQKSIFASVLIIIFSVLIIASVCLWVYLYGFLEAYEKNVPINTANKIAELYKEENFSEIFSMQGITPDKFNTIFEYEKFFREKYGDDFSDVRAAKIAKSGEDEVYAVLLGNEKLCEFLVTEEGTEDKYGFKARNTEMKPVDYPKEYSVSVTVPKGAKVYLNDDVLLSDKEKKTTDHAIKGYDELYDEALKPSFEYYEVKNLLNKPSLKVFSENGEEMKLSGDNGEFYALPEVSPEMEALAKSLSEEVAVKYALYGITDIKFAELSPYLFPECEYYKTVKGFYNDWYAEHTFSYDEVSHSDIKVYDDTHFSVRIKFVYHINIGWKIVDYNVDYNMFFIKSNGRWLLCGMEL